MQPVHPWRRHTLSIGSKSGQTPSAYPTNFEEANARHCETPLPPSTRAELPIEFSTQTHTHTSGLYPAQQLHLRGALPNVLILSRFFLGCCLRAWDRSTVRAENISKFILPARKIEFESCKEMKKRSDSKLSKKNGGIIRPKGIVFETFWANSPGGFEGSQTFFKKNILHLHLSSFSLSSSLSSSLFFSLSSSLFFFSFIFDLLYHFLFHFLFHLFSSLSFSLSSVLLSCLFALLSSLLLS